MLLIVCFGEVVFFFPEISNNAKCSAAVWNSELSKYLTHTQTHTHTHIDTAIRSQGYEAHVPENQSKSITISFDLRLQSGTALFDVIQSSCVPSLSSQPSDDLHYRVFRTVYHSNDTLWFYLSGLECLREKNPETLCWIVGIAPAMMMMMMMMMQRELMTSHQTSRRFSYLEMSQMYPSPCSWQATHTWCIDFLVCR